MNGDRTNADRVSADDRSGGAGRRSSRPVGSAVSVAAVVLAAGTSSRWRGAGSKQLHPWRGEPLVRRIARSAAESEASEVVVVTGHDAEGVERALDGLAVRVVHNPLFASGQASSVRAGIAALAPAVDGALFVPCDQPLLDAATLDLLIARFRALPPPQRRARAVVPAFRGRRGAPALIGREILPRFSDLEEDEGGRRVLAAIPERVVEVELASGDPLVDVDTLADLRALEGIAEAATSSS
jgi:molybdenum cofactor cytidylyltransferase